VLLDLLLCSVGHWSWNCGSLSGNHARPSGVTPPFLPRRSILTDSVPVTVCERSTEMGMSRVSPQLLLTRTMEIYRAIGLADDIIKESQRYVSVRGKADIKRWYSENGGILVMESLTSSSPMATYSPTLNSGIHEISPAKRVFVTHHMLLRILRRRVKSLQLIKVRYECSVSDIFQNTEKVTAKLKNGGEITAKYCIGCDGADGLAKKIVSKDNVTGHGLLSNSLTIVFRVHPPPPLLLPPTHLIQCFTCLLL